ncbi:MAG: NUDIX hydrolase [Pseudorhodoplanes sp.]
MTDVSPQSVSRPVPAKAVLRPRDAATLILIDRSGSAPKVLLGRRNEKHVFMPGKFVFPGGRVEPQDRLMPVVKPLHPQTEAKLMEKMSRPSLARARALALAAIRETFEETGLVLGGKGPQAARIPGGAWAEFAATGFYPDLSLVHYVARAITPPGRQRRFDARFFCADADAIVHRVENMVHADAELVELAWIPIAEAKRLDIPPITGMILDELQGLSAAGMTYDRPVPFFRKLGRTHRREII